MIWIQSQNGLPSLPPDDPLISLQAFVSSRSGGERGMLVVCRRTQHRELEASISILTSHVSLLVCGKEIIKGGYKKAEVHFMG